MGQWHGMPGERSHGRSVGIDQQQVLAGGERQCLAVIAPGKSGGPSRRTMQQARFAGVGVHVPEPHAAVLATAGQHCATGFPGQFQHTG